MARASTLIERIIAEGQRSDAAFFRERNRAEIAAADRAARNFAVKQQFDLAHRREDRLDRRETREEQIRRLPLLNRQPDAPQGERIAIDDPLNSTSPARAFRAQGAIQELLLSPAPATPDGAAEGVAGVIGDADTTLGDALAPHSRARARKFAADFARVSEIMGQNGVTSFQRQDLQRQLAEKYPEFAARGLTATPMTSEQAAQLREQVQTQEINAAAQAILRGETPDRLVFRDARGNFVIPPALEKLQAMKFAEQKIARDRELDAARQREDQFNAEMRLLKEAEPPKPSRDATPEEIAEHDRAMRRLNVRRRELLNERFSADGVDVSPQRARHSLQVAERTGAAFVESQADYDDLAPGAVGVTPDGQTFRKPGAGDTILDIDDPSDPRLADLPAGAKIRFRGQIIIKE